MDKIISCKVCAFYKFSHEIYLPLEGLRYLLPGFQRRQARVLDSLLLLLGSTLEKDIECTINVSKFGNVKLGHLPGTPKAEKLSDSGDLIRPVIVGSQFDGTRSTLLK